MTGDLRLAEVTTVKDGLLDSQVAHNTDTINGALQSQWHLICDGLAQGADQRAQQAKNDSLLTGVEIAGSFGLGAGMTWAMKAGGRWGAAAELGAAAFTGLMGYDLFRRGSAIQEAYANSSGDTAQGQLMRKDAIARYAGSGLVDYSLMIASGGLGAASVHYGPKIASNLSTTLEPLGKLTTMEPALQPARSFNFMDLGETGRLGAKEKPLAASDPISSARARLEFPHRSVGLDQLSALMEAKQIAAHPEVRPLYEQMADTLGKVDTLKPKLSTDESALAALEKDLSAVKSLKPEIQAVRSAETNINSVKADMERITALREEQGALTRQIQEASKSAKDQPADPAAAAKKAAKKDDSVDVDALRARRREVSESITNIQARAQDLPKFEQRLAEARDAFEKRKAAIESGEDAEVKGITAQMEPLKAQVEAQRAELAALSDQLKGLDGQIATKADAVRPTLKDADPSAILGDVPRYNRPKIEVPESRQARRAEPRLPEPPTEARLNTPTKDVPAKALEQPVTKTQQAERVEPKRVEQTVAGADRPTTEADVNQAFNQAKRAADDFAATHKRHTTALKQVKDYIDTSFDWFAADPKASANAAQVAKNVSDLLGKLENWDRSPAWIRNADRAQIMQRNGFDAATMNKFDQWYQTQSRNYNETPNMMPDRKLVDIQQHLSRRVAVESVKNWLRTAPDVQGAISPIVNDGFRMMAEGKLPDGRAIPKGSDMIVFEKRTVKGPDGDTDIVMPFAKDGQHMQRFDDAKISEGLRKLEAMQNGGPQALSEQDLYGFRLDHDPSRLMASGEQAGFAILRPGTHGKNILYMQFADGIDPAIIPKPLRADGATSAGTNTGVLYNMLRNSARPK